MKDLLQSKSCQKDGTSVTLHKSTMVAFLIPFVKGADNFCSLPSLQKLLFIHT